MRARWGNCFAEQHALARSDWSFRMYDFVTLPDTDPHDVAHAIESVRPDLTLYVRGTALTERVWDATRRNEDASSKWYKTHWFEQEVGMQDGEPSKQGWANGVVWTSWRQVDVEQEPALHVSFGLYNQECHDPTCRAGHMNDKRHPIMLKRAPALRDTDLWAIEEEIGVHPDYRLERRATAHNRDVLTSLGFLPLDAPLKDEPVGQDRLYKALDWLAREDENAVASLADRFFTEAERGLPELQLFCATGGGTFSYKLFELLRAGYDIDVNMVGAIVKARSL